MWLSDSRLRLYRDIVSEDDEAEIYARAVWEMLSKELAENVNATPGLALSV